MLRCINERAFVLAVGMVLGVSSNVFGDSYRGESARASIELQSVDRTWRVAVDDLNRARASLDAARAEHARLALSLDAVSRSIPSLRQNVAGADVALRRAQTDHARAQAEAGELHRRVQIGEQRLADARGYIESTRARLVADFEHGRELRHASAELASAQARLDQSKNAVIGYLETTSRFRWIRGEVRRLEEEIGYLQAGRPVDRRRLASAERALADARRDLDDAVNRALAQDLAVREAGIAANAASDRIRHLRECYQRDLPSRRELRDAYAAVAREEHALTCARTEHADAHRRVELLCREVEKHTACFAEATRALQCAETDLARLSHETNNAAVCVASADQALHRLIAVECHARESRERAHARLALLDRRDRGDDRHNRDDWRGGRGRDDDDDDRRNRGNAQGRDKKEDWRRVSYGR